jgi:hypothetical protein
MVELPLELSQRLRLPEAHALRRALAVVAEELPGVYADNVRDQRPRDNANIFGLRVAFHLWAALDEREADLGEARVIELNNARFLAVGDFKVAIHKLGHHVADDIHSSFPEGSPTQRSYAQRNANQLTLFESAPEAPLPEDRAFALRDLVVGHFGNLEDGLAKWYLGAPTYDDDGRPHWAWLAPQPTASSRPAPQVDVTPYSEREPAAVEVKPRERRADAETSSDSGPGA